jgi:hypothetical protein
MERWWADILSWSSYSSSLGLLKYKNNSKNNTTTTTTTTIDNNTNINNTNNTNTLHISDDDNDDDDRDDANNHKPTTTTTTTTYDDNIRGIIAKTAKHTIYYDKSHRRHRRSAGKVLTQNEQRHALSKKRLHILNRKFLAGIIILTT